MGFKEDILAKMESLKAEKEEKERKIKFNTEQLFEEMKEMMLTGLSMYDIENGVKITSYTDASYFVNPKVEIDLTHLYSICRNEFTALDWEKNGDGITLKFHLDLMAVQGKNGRYQKVFESPAPTSLSWENNEPARSRMNH